MQANDYKSHISSLNTSCLKKLEQKINKYRCNLQLLKADNLQQKIQHKKRLY